MKIKLLLLLSLFGLGMAVATVYLIPSDSDPVFWLPVFIICAVVIARETAAKRFLHGLVLGLLNSFWITIAHILLFDQYIANHIREAEMLSMMPYPDSPRLMMLITGPVIGLFSGIGIGLFALVASRFLTPRKS
ncbi:MAG: hypothetical protein KKD74_14530 [Bacteroidetes bacterium]|nr:hypothetical protein [Bacteroidota bacterium]